MQSGEDRILLETSAHVVTTALFVMQVNLLQALTQFWMMAVISGCLGAIGNQISTNQAQNHRRFSNATSSQRQRRRHRNAGGDTPDGDNTAASYSRFSSDLQREESNIDQQRKCREAAEANGHRIDESFEFADEAVSGTKAQREGLDALVQAASLGAFKVLYLHSLSRLARESVITMPLLKKMVHVYGVRVISVSESIDTSRGNWEVIASIMSLMHERYIKELAANVFRGQEGAIHAGFSVGDFCFGYSSESVPGTESQRRGRNSKPRKQYVIDDVAACWVARIFDWFVTEKQSIRWITRKLNALKAPKDHRATTPEWHHQQVALLLANEKYVGVWLWGEMQNTRDPETGKIRQEPRSSEACEQYRLDMGHLRIIDDDTFQKAQQRLEENYQRYAKHRKSNGQLKGRPVGVEDNSPRHLLSGMVACASCGATFHVGGSGGKYLFCPKYKQGVCSCQSTLNRQRAERMILHEIGARILCSREWLEAVLKQTLESCRQRSQQHPAEIAAVETSLADVEQKIGRLIDRIESGLDDAGVSQRLAQRQRERRELLKSLERLQRLDMKPTPQPTEEWVRNKLSRLGDVLSGASPSSAMALRDLIDGKIVVTEIRREGKKRGHLQGRLTISATAIASAFVETGDACGERSKVEKIVIDFVEENPIDGESETAKKLYDEGLLNVEIADRLNCSKSKVTKLMRHWFESRGLPMPDGRSRRSALPRKHQDPPQYQRISEEVKRIADTGLLLEEIAEQLDCDRNTVTSSLRFWYTSRGQIPPDGRTRRKSLNRKSRSTRSPESPPD